MLKDKRTGIIYERWRTPSPPEAVFLLVHGLGAHSGRWAFLGEFFLLSGISSYSLELRGFGETEGLKGHADSLDLYLNEMIALRDIIVGENPGRDIFLVGESFGAILSILLAAGRKKLFKGLICLSPAFTSKMKAPVSFYLKILFSFFKDPKKQFIIPFDSSMCTRDAEYRRKMDSDPREHRLATAGFIVKLLIGQLKAMRAKKELDLPVLFLISGEDKLVDAGVSERVFKGINSADKTLIKYPGMYHALSIELGKEKVFEDIAEWVRERVKKC